jgi:hypothetical protein
MRKEAMFMSLLVGCSFILAALGFFINGFIMRQVGVRVAGVIVKKEVFDNGVVYTIKCKYNNKIYVLTQDLGSSNYIANDSFTYFFNPNKERQLVYAVDPQFQIDWYIGFLTGLVLIMFARLLHLKRIAVFNEI